MKILIYEDGKWPLMSPLSLIKPVFELRCGFNSLFEKIVASLPEGEKGLWVRSYLQKLAGKKYNLPVNDESFLKSDLLLVNGRWLKTDGKPILSGTERVVKSGTDILYAFIKKETAGKFWNGDFEEFLQAISGNVESEERKAALLEYPWDIVRNNAAALTEDFMRTGKSGILGNFSAKAEIAGAAESVFISKKARVHPFVVIDASKGPVYVEEEAEIFPFSRIEGPCYIGRASQIMPGANIREGNSFGPVCRIGGEVETSVFHSYANKYHDGFTGHSYIGEFVNLGALTANSDLQNNYANVTVYPGGKPLATGCLKVGAFIGDHTKTSIGVLLNTGTIAGMMCNITAGGISPKYFPSFIWYLNSRFMKGYGLESMLDTAKTVMARRKREWLPEEEFAIRHVYEETAPERISLIKRNRKR